jgi:flagellar M-ring protein FliF
MSDIEGVESARVHIVVPQPRLFKEDNAPATASVVLNMTPGAMLSARQVQAIAHMTAYSVEGLEVENISILDSRGNLLSKNEHDPLAGLSSSQQEYQSSIEHGLEKKATELLQDVLGPDRARVQVTVKLNWNRIERTVEDYDPEKVATLSEEVQSTEGAEDGTTERTITNYQIPKTIEKIVPEVGNIEKLWASVLVDGNYETTAGESGGQTKTYIERTPEELEKFRTLVAGAIGYDLERDDELTVLSFPFSVPEEPVQETGGFMNNGVLQKIIEKIVIVALLVLIFLLLRGLLAKMSSNYPALPSGAMAPAQLAGSGRATIAAPGTGTAGGASATALREPPAPAAVAAAMASHEAAEAKALAVAEGVAKQTSPKVIFKQSPQTIVLEQEGPSVETLKHQELLKRATEYVIQEPEGAAQILRSWILDESS